MSPLPFKEEAPGGSFRQAGLVVPHQVPAHKQTVVPRIQSGVEHERVVLRADETGRCEISLNKIERT